MKPRPISTSTLLIVSPCLQGSMATRLPQRATYKKVAHHSSSPRSQQCQRFASSSCAALRRPTTAAAVRHARTHTYTQLHHPGHSCVQTLQARSASSQAQAQSQSQSQSHSQPHTPASKHKKNTTPAPKPYQPPPASRSSSTPTGTIPTIESLDPAAHDKLNPPPSSYAPPLSVMPRGPNQGLFRYAWQSGRAYFSFYKAGIKNVRSTAKVAREIRRKSTSPKVLTRSEWQLIKRSRRDVLRLPAFAAFLLVFGEWTPLLVRWLTPIIPEPCRIPGQIERSLKKLEEHRRERVSTLLSHSHGRSRVPGQSLAGKPVMLSPNAVTPGDVQHLDGFNLRYLSARLDVYSWVWEYFMSPPTPFLRWALGRKVRYLATDDGLIVRDGGVAGLGEKEVWRGCIERGIEVRAREDAELRVKLVEWIEGRKV